MSAFNGMMCSGGTDSFHLLTSLLLTKLKLVLTDKSLKIREFIIIPYISLTITHNLISSGCLHSASAGRVFCFVCCFEKKDIRANTKVSEECDCARSPIRPMALQLLPETQQWSCNQIFTSSSLMFQHTKRTFQVG